jgi:hypothetical protein
MFYVLIAISALAKAFMDASAHGAFAGDTFWDETIAWKNKWKNGEKSQGEKFLGSSTVFSFVTSGWHLSQFVFLNALIGSIFLSDQITDLWAADFLIVSVAFRVIFEIPYRLLKG